MKAIKEPGALIPKPGMPHLLSDGPETAVCELV